MKNSSTLGLSILTGGLAFVGSASAIDIVIDGSYESATNNYVTPAIGNAGNDSAGIDGGWTHFSTYNYSAGYTQAGPLGSGAVYLRPYNTEGGITVVRQTNSLTRAITAAEIDAAAGQYTISAWFSTYLGQNDYSTLTLQFLNSSFASVGSPIEIGGAAFVAALPGEGARAWGRDAKIGAVPAGARYAAITTVATAFVNLPDGYVDLVQLDISTDASIALASATPANAAANVSPTVVISVGLQDGSPAPVLNPSSIQFSFDGAPVASVIQKVGGLTTVQYDPPGLLTPLSIHTYRIAFNDVGGAIPNTTNEFTFTAAEYYNLLLNTPLYLETFESTPEGGLPAGWTSVSLSGQAGMVCDPLAVGINGLQDLYSACYTNWVVVDSTRFTSNMFTYASHTPESDYQRVLNTNRINMVNSNLVGNLAQGKVVFGNSGYQNDLASQILYLFSPDFDLTGRTNVYLAYNSLYEQNQDAIGAVEYSIDQGATWLPVVYLLHGPDILRDANGNIDGVATFGTSRIGAFEGQATYMEGGNTRGGNYGAFIGVDSNRWNQLGPFISARLDDNAAESKRIEAFRLPAADNQSRVRLRFAYAGTDSWYFGLDNIGLYSLNVLSAPFVSPPSPGSLVEGVGNTAVFNVTLSGLGPFTYQWQRAGVNLPGQTNATLVLTNLQLSSAGSYAVVIGYVGGSITSSPAVLNVHAPEAARVIGQWDFTDFFLTATCGQDLQFFDAIVDFNTSFDTVGGFGLPNIDGTPEVSVMSFPGPLGPNGNPGYKMFHGLTGTAGGTNVNQYTLIMDVLYTGSSHSQRRSLLQTAPFNTDDGEFRINEANGVGVTGNYQGNILSNTWHRIALAVDLGGPGTNPIVAKFVDGIKVAQHVLPEGRDGRWSLSAGPTAPWALLFADDNVDLQPGFASSIQLRDGRLSDTAIAAMGRPQATKIPGAICAQYAAGILTIRWSGVLESADNATGPWSPVVGATKPYQVQTSAAARKFYRSR